MQITFSMKSSNIKITSKQPRVVDERGKGLEGTPQRLPFQGIERAINIGIEVESGGGKMKQDDI